MSEKHRHRYGEKVATTPEGRYYYCAPLEILTFVQKGRQAEGWTAHAKTIGDAMKALFKREQATLHINLTTLDQCDPQAGIHTSPHKGCILR